MGFENQRLKKPDLSWEALLEFGKHQGEISTKDRDVHPKIMKGLKYHKWTIKRRLKELFNIESDPFYPFNRKEKSYRLKCTISVMEDYC